MICHGIPGTDSLARRGICILYSLNVDMEYSKIIVVCPLLFRVVETVVRTTARTQEVERLRRQSQGMRTSESMDGEGRQCRLTPEEGFTACFGDLYSAKRVLWHLMVSSYRDNSNN